LGDTLEPPPPEESDAADGQPSASRRLLVSSADSVRSIRLDAGTVLTVGRLHDNDIVVAHETVSGVHARIRVTDQVMIEDAGSRNGIYYNGSRVPRSAAVAFEPGCVVQIGPASLFVVDGAELLRQNDAREERARIVDALARAHGNQVVAARLLGVSRRTLINRLEAYQIPRPRKGQR
jgi:pSer/pThr/pTyr-binding forkhead associated (FHA) protein